jgi:hypothetical protein
MITASINTVSTTDLATVVAQVRTTKGESYVQLHDRVLLATASNAIFIGASLLRFQEFGDQFELARVFRTLGMVRSGKTIAEPGELLTRGPLTVHAPTGICLRYGRVLGARNRRTNAYQARSWGDTYRALSLFQEVQK